MAKESKIKSAALKFQKDFLKATGVENIKVATKRLQSEWDDLTDDEITNHVAHMMVRCARDLKIEPKDLTWYDFREYTGYAFGQSGSSGLVPKHITRIGGFEVIKTAYFPPEVTNISIEREDIKERARLKRSVSLMGTRETLFHKQWEEIATRVFKDLKIQPSGYALKKTDNKKVERHLNLLLSDLHFQSLLDDGIVPQKYGATEESRRFAKVLLSAAEYKLDYRDNTELNLFIAGDIIQGQLHDPRDGAPQAEQVAAAQWYLLHGIRFLSEHFKKIRVYFAVGNHGRNTSRHRKQAVNDKYDAVEQEIYSAVKLACWPLKNVEFSLNKRPYITYESFGQKGFITHGDTIFNPGYPGKSINTKSIEGQINKLNAALPDAEEYKLLAVGHVHVGSATQLANGAVFITNGALIPTDQYGQSIGYPESSCGQTMWESVPGFIFGDYRFINVNRETDKDASLDKIIPPWPGF